jgi:hypothetical protein
MNPQKKTRASRRRHATELDGGEAFLHDSRYGFAPVKEGDVEAFGEEFIAGATSNAPVGELARDEAYFEKIGPFAFELYDEEEFNRTALF